MKTTYLQKLTKTMSGAGRGWVRFGAAGLFFVFGLTGARAANTYNLVQDDGFKNANPIWVTFKNTDETNVNRAAGSIDLLKGLSDAPPQLLRFAYLSQELSNRKVSEIDNLSWQVKYSPAMVDTSQTPYWFGVIVSGYAEPRGMCELKYFYRGAGVSLPAESDKEKNIILSLPAKDTFYLERRDLKEDWRTAGFVSTAEIVKIKLIGGSVNEPAELKPGGYGQTVWWNDLKVLSTRFDHDVAPLTVLSGDQIQFGRSYIPRVLAKNTGAYNETFRIAATIFKDQVKVYSDTVGGIIIRNVPPDETREMEFKRYVPKEAGNYSIEMTTILKEDQNPENNTIQEKLRLVEAKPK